MPQDLPTRLQKAEIVLSQDSTHRTNKISANDVAAKRHDKGGRVITLDSLGEMTVRHYA